MRRFPLAAGLFMAVLLPSTGTAQVLNRPNSYPAVTAATAVWQFRGDPVFHAGAFYYPAGPSVFFDGNVMARTGTYEGVPIYEDATLAPFTIVYVPIGGNVVRPYERRREGDLADTVGSRPPSFPIRRAGETWVDAVAPVDVERFAPGVDGFVPAIPEEPSPIGTAGSVAAIPGPISTIRPERRNVRVIFQVWVPYQGARWTSAGAAVPYLADRFVQVGDHHGFPVYRQRNGSADRIYIPSVAGGPVAPYDRNR